MEQAAALSYYTLLSLAPLVLLAVAVAGLVFERPAVEGRIVTEMRALVGDEGADVVEAVLRNANNPGRGMRSVVISMVLLAVGATTVFAQLPPGSGQSASPCPACHRGTAPGSHIPFRPRRSQTARDDNFSWVSAPGLRFFQRGPPVGCGGPRRSTPHLAMA